MKRLTERLEDGRARAKIADYGEPPYPMVTNDFIETLAVYEDTGLTPQEIEQMKARMPLHQWAGESADKMSIFGVAVSRLMELAKADKEGRLAIFSIEDIHPCRGCNNGWGTISSEGCTTCEETCVRLKEYCEKYNT